MRPAKCGGLKGAHARGLRLSEWQVALFFRLSGAGTRWRVWAGFGRFGRVGQNDPWVRSADSARGWCAAVRGGAGRRTAKAPRTPRLWVAVGLFCQRRAAMVRLGARRGRLVEVNFQKPDIFGHFRTLGGVDVRGEVTKRRSDGATERRREMGGHLVPLLASPPLRAFVPQCLRACLGALRPPL